jgi:acyl carrier protein
MEEKIIEIINSILVDGGQPEVKITKESNLKDDIGLDSFELAMLTVQIEDKFGVDIFENSFPQTISDIIEILGQ